MSIQVVVNLLNIKTMIHMQSVSLRSRLLEKELKLLSLLISIEILC